MIAFDLKKQIEINEGYQNIQITEYKVNAGINSSDELIVEAFIHSMPFLVNVFDVEYIKIEDFRKFDKAGVIKFLIEFSNEPDWSDDRDNFVRLLDKYFELHYQFGDGSFYILNKVWFNKNDRKIKSESWIYIYYFFVLYADSKTNTLVLSEWIYD
jgi:hypothetical protein